MESNCFAKQVNARINECKGTRRSNCRGTALYLVGESEGDVVVDSGNRLDLQLKNMRRVKEPAERSLVVWRSRKTASVLHMGVVTSVNPVLVTNRESADGVVFENQPIAEIQNTYDNCAVEYYLPSGLLQRTKR